MKADSAQFDLTKEETYLVLAQMMEKDTPVNQEQLLTFIDVLNKDLARHDNKLKILNILKLMLDKIKAGIYPKLPSLKNTMVSVINQLNNVDISETNVTGKNNHQLYLETLLQFPDDVFTSVSLQISESMLKLVETHLKATPNVPHCDMITSLLSKYLQCLTEDDKIEFIKSGLNLWLLHLIPFLFLDDNDNREFGINIAEEIVPHIVKVNVYNHPLWSVISSKIKSRTFYPQFLVNLQNNNNQHWRRLWIVLVRMCDKELHKFGSNINHMLYALQEGFKKSVDCKYQAFLCLQALIENFALDEKILFSTSRIKLVSIALESNNAKTEEIGLLKFDVWWNLITLLRTNIKPHSRTILMPFLCYCFGEPKSSNTTNKKYPGEVFESVQRLAIKSIVEMFGHVNCSGCIHGDFKKLSQPILNSEMWIELSVHWIWVLRNVTVFISSHLPKANKSKSDFESLTQNLRCIWQSFVKVSSNIKTEMFAVGLKSLLNLLDIFVDKHSHNPLFAEIIMTIIIPSIVDKNGGYSVTALNDNSIIPSKTHTPIQTLLKFVLLPKLYHADTMSKLHFDFENLIQIGLMGGFKEFVSWIIDEISSDGHGPLVWCYLADALSASIQQIDIDVYSTVLMWPIVKYNGNAKIVNVSAAWRKLYGIQRSKIRVAKENTINQIDIDVVSGLLKINNKNNRNAINLIPIYFLTSVIKRFSDEKPGQMGVMNSFFMGMEKFLNNLPVGKIPHILYISLVDSLKQLSSILLHCHTYHVSLSSAEHLISVLNKNIKIISNYLTQGTHDHGNTQETINTFNSLLDSLHSLIIPVYFASVVDNLLDIVNNLMRNIKNPNIQSKCVDLLEHIVEPNKKEPILEKSELIKIQALLIARKVNEQTPESSPCNSKVTPITPKTYTKKSNTLAKTKDDFVIIEPNWKFDPKKLTEHQKDVLKRRRDDIPALYEDLSQSQDENLLKSWKPAGYNKSSSDNSSSQDLSSQGLSDDKTTVTNSFKHSIDKVVPKKDIKTNSEKNSITLRSAKVVVAEQNENILKNDKKLNVSTNNQVLSEIGHLKSNGLESESGKTVLGTHQLNGNVENKETKFKTPTRSDNQKNRRSIFSRINDNLQQLKSPKDKNKIDEDICDKIEVKVLSVSVTENNQSVTNQIVVDNQIQEKQEDKVIKSKNDNSTINLINNDNTTNKKDIEPIVIEKNSSSATQFTINVLNDTTDNEIKKHSPSDEGPTTNNKKKRPSGDESPTTDNKKKRSSRDGGPTTDYPTDIILISDESDQINKISNETNKQDDKDTTPSRPTRIRRKPNKFITDASLELKTSKMNMSKNDESLSNKDEECMSPKTEINVSSELCKSPVTPKSLKKKSRLMNQLAINTNEGHPSIDIIKSNRNVNTRKTRRSLITIETKVNQKKSSQTDAEGTAKASTITPDVKKDVPSINSLPIEKALDNNISCIESTCTVLISDIDQLVTQTDSKSKNSFATAEDKDFLKNPETISVNIDQNTLSNTNGSVSASVDDKSTKVLHSVEVHAVDVKNSNVDDTDIFENNCNALFETSSSDLKTVASIFSQETEVVPHNSKFEFSSYGNKPEELDIFSNDQESFTKDDFTCAQNDDDITCSPDFIESSQEESLSSMSLKTIISKAKELESSKSDKNKSVDYSMLSSQQIAEAETQPLSGEMIEGQNILPTNCEDACTDTTSIDKVKTIDDVPSNIAGVILMESENGQNFSNIDEKETQCDEVDNSNDLNQILHLNSRSLSPLSITFNNSIVSSPCKDDIQDRNRELLNNTVDISPIKGVTFSTDDSPIRKTSPDKADTTVANTPKEVSQSNSPLVLTSPDLFSSEKISPNKDNVPVKQISPPKVNTPMITHNARNNWLSIKHVGSRTAQMLSLCMINDKIEDDDGNSAATDDASNNRKSVPSTNSERWDGVLNFNNISNKESADMQPLLEFTKLIPSLSASPIGPILKRKLENDDLTISPSSKKKRVSFHDPPVSTTVSVEKYIGTKTAKSPQVKDNPTIKRNRVAVAKCLMKTIQMAATAPPENAIITDNILNIDNDVVQIESDVPISDICSLVVNSPQILDIAQNDMFDSTLPIYPNLVDCQVPIIEISCKLSSPMWKNDFVKEISDKVLTIGDLAKLTEVEVNRLPVKYPKIATVKQALSEYEAKLNRENLCGNVQDDSIVVMEDVEIEDDANHSLVKVSDDNVEKTVDENMTVDEFVFDEHTEVILKEIEKNDVMVNCEDRQTESSDKISADSKSEILVESANACVENPVTMCSLITANPIEALKLVINVSDTDVILDNIPLTSITGYLLRKMDSNRDVQKEVMESLNASHKSEKEVRDTLLKSFKDKLSADFNGMLNSLDKILES
ncbi:rap1 interacting factor 1 [Arctopsyche grandis]|uniref:rap1 interacting factor 1 n=1 Tax=Arctopsyche grandis TaxID=121162 RepID=UPI00406D85F2